MGRMTGIDFGKAGPRLTLRVAGIIAITER